MQVTCEYCGGMIDITKNHTCPNCGASFDENEQMKKLLNEEKEKERLRKEEIQLRMESQRLQNERARVENEIRRKTVKPRKANKRIIMIVGAIIILSVLGSILSEPLPDVSSIPIETEPVIVETPVEVKFGETASTSTYSVVCDQFEEYYYAWDAPPEGFKYIRVHFIVTNIIEKEIFSDEGIVGSYYQNGYLTQAERPTIHSEDLDTRIRDAYIAPNNSIQGWVYFTVPVDADLILKYGDYITINVDAKHCIDLNTQ